jgi:hypothetical protein
MKWANWKRFVDGVVERTDLTVGQQTAMIAKRLYVEEGIPFEISRESAEKYGHVIDEGYFELLLDEERKLSRANSKFRKEIF